MKSLLGLITSYLLLAAIPAVSQTPVPPFQDLEKQVQMEPGGWNGDKERLSVLFDKERRRLGAQFEAELLKYVAGNPEKHYWISLFLDEQTYLHGSKPLPQLSLLLMEQGISMLRGKTDKESAGQTFTLMWSRRY